MDIDASQFEENSQPDVPGPYRIMNSKLYNHFAWGAANFQNNEFLFELMFKAAVLDFEIDMQTYIKCQLCLYFQDDNQYHKFEQSNMDLLYLYNLYAKDLEQHDNFA